MPSDEGLGQSENDRTKGHHYQGEIVEFEIDKVDAHWNHPTREHRQLRSASNVPPTSR